MENLTAKIKEILDTPDKQIDIDYAATILLKVNRNRILNQNIIRRRDIAKLRYELQKIYNFRAKEDALEETKQLEKEVIPVLTVTLPAAAKIEASENKGMRVDHEQLPDEIKALYLENLNSYHKMRKLHEQLKLMGDAKPCDRYPFLKELVDLDKEVRENWNAYDAFVIVPKETEETEGSANNIADNANNIAPDAKKISASRKYLSDNKTKLAELRVLEDQSKYLELLSKMQERLTFLIDVKAGVSDEQLEELKALGLNA